MGSLRKSYAKLQDMEDINLELNSLKNIIKNGVQGRHCYGKKS